MSEEIFSISDSGAIAGFVNAPVIDLDKLDEKIQDEVDLVGYRLTGQARLVHELHKHNYISCLFDNVFANEIDFTRCDFKDVLIKDSHFRKCQIQAATHSTTVYVDTLFEQCDFTNAAQTNCEFRRTNFSGCHLSNLLTKRSRFFDSVFSDCKSATHVFEGNVFQNTRFARTDLEVRTITSNFGLKYSLTDDFRIRTKRISENYNFVEPNELMNLFEEKRSADPLARLSIIYFINGNLLSGSHDVDSVFDMKNWLSVARQPASFVDLLELLSEFLVNAYEENEVDIHKILLLHDVTRQLIEGAGNDSSGIECGSYLEVSTWHCRVWLKNTLLFSRINPACCQKTFRL